MISPNGRKAGMYEGHTYAAERIDGVTVLYRDRNAITLDELPEVDELKEVRGHYQFLAASGRPRTKPETLISRR